MGLLGEVGLRQTPGARELEAAVLQLAKSTRHLAPMAVPLSHPVSDAEETARVTAAVHRAVAHVFNNRLTVISGYAELNGLSSDPVISRSLERITGMVAGLPRHESDLVEMAHPSHVLKAVRHYVQHGEIKQEWLQTRLP